MSQSNDRENSRHSLSHQSPTGSLSVKQKLMPMLVNLSKLLLSLRNLCSYSFTLKVRLKLSLNRCYTPVKPLVNLMSLHKLHLLARFLSQKPTNLLKLENQRLSIIPLVPLNLLPEPLNQTCQSIINLHTFRNA